MINWRALLTTLAKKALRRAERHDWEVEDITDDGAVELIRVYWPNGKRRRLAIYVHEDGTVTAN